MVAAHRLLAAVDVHAGVVVDLKQPGLVALINQDIKTVNLKAVAFEPSLLLGLCKVLRLREEVDHAREGGHGAAADLVYILFNGFNYLFVFNLC